MELYQLILIGIGTGFVGPGLALGIPLIYHKWFNKNRKFEGVVGRRTVVTKGDTYYCEFDSGHPWGWHSNTTGKDANTSQGRWLEAQLRLHRKNDSDE